MPNPNSITQRRPQAIGRTTGFKLGAYGSGINVDMPKQRANPEESHKVRDFKINAKIIGKFGYSQDCPGCESHSQGLSKKHHTLECRKGIEDEMLHDAEEQYKIEGRNKRKGTDQDTLEAHDEDPVSRIGNISN